MSKSLNQLEKDLDLTKAAFDRVDLIVNYPTQILRSLTDVYRKALINLLEIIKNDNSTFVFDDNNSLNQATNNLNSLNEICHKRHDEKCKEATLLIINKISEQNDYIILDDFLDKVYEQHDPAMLGKILDESPEL